MRQVFSSQRLENTEAVAQMLREAGIEVRITGARSYKGNRRRTFSYTDRNTPRSEVWVVKAEDQTLARSMLREAGLMDSTRGDAHSYRMPSFHSQVEDDGGRKRNGRIRMFLLAAIAVVMVMSVLRNVGEAPAPTATAPTPAAEPTPTSPLPAIARAVLPDEIATAGVPVVCLGLDGRNPPPALIEALSSPDRTLVAASACISDDERGNRHRASGQPAIIMDVGGFEPTAGDAGTVRFSAYLQPSIGEYKTLEVRRVDGQWRVVRTIKHVVLRG